ncbi:hypothetical protein A4H97_30145 [Niastella yeongjuensis]|uniref:Peptidase M17 leucyl aminopeptidase N-terminal domain-containing protein n=1 Tax=Niastella yeongjuensis TaxID=354355 RepID=A0A1V9EQD9_9BACT|nr:M17 family peptidase N-terminal domain-containing protein [Niastella yeongjuensis]OQP48095.1 hypothetical protein A4H97_30145 [Niastella yeongjuensis]SEO26516.1 Cytosol aminopeptidase family, N-terminal domain [Niastella yeongjuensis]
MSNETTQSSTVTPFGTTKIWGKVDEIEYEGVVQGPSTQTTPLQVACLFEYVEGDIFNPPALPAELNGMVHLDSALDGLITAMRSSGQFEGRELETLHLQPPKGKISADQLLLIGLGNRNMFSVDLMIAVSRTALREALRLGVTSYSFAADIKDAGVESVPNELSERIVQGAVEAYRVQLMLQSKAMTSFKPLTKISLLAGTAFFVTAGTGILNKITEYNSLKL